MQVMRDEREAHALVKNHLERTVDGARVVVLNRNASSDRLEASHHRPGGVTAGAEPPGRPAAILPRGATRGALQPGPPATSR